MSKMPTTASSPAAVVAGIPWSWAAGTKWVLDDAVGRPAAHPEGEHSDQNVQRLLALRSTVDRDPGGRVAVRSASTTTLPGSRP